MNKVIFGLQVFLFSSLVSAQITVAPFGSAGAQGTPPVGSKKSGGSCADKGCIEFVIKPSCFGTNLRAYNADNQMKENEDVVIEFALENKQDSSKKDILKIQYPATLTFDTSGVRRDCTFNSGANMNDSSPKNITCTKPGTEQSLTYTLLDWKKDKNPSCYANGGSHGQEYCDYAGVILVANLAGGGMADPKINCIYKLNNQYKVVNDKVSCLFESELQDRKDEVKVFLNGQDISSDPKVKKTAFVNRIITEIGASFNSMNLSPLVHHGAIKPMEAPNATYKFSQLDSSNNSRAIADIVENSGFDSANKNRSYTMTVKHPGVEGFCGGFYSPLMLFFDDQLPKFNGVSLFPLYGSEPGQRVYWPEKYAPGYFLVNLKGKKKIESDDQLFGQNDKFQNGFDSLAIHDSNKDGKINKGDKIFNSLMLWNDENGNGLSEDNELFSLKDKGVVSIDLNYHSKNPSKFANRARAREKSKFSFIEKGKTLKGEIFDVWLAPIK